MTNPSAGAEPPPRLPTGIAGLDMILHGGLMPGDMYLVSGPAGAGKTVLGNQVSFHHVAAGGRVVYVTLLAETHARMFSHLRSMTFFRPEVIGEALYYLSGYAALEEDGLHGLVDLLRRVIRERRASLLVIDGLETAAAAADAHLVLRRFIHELHSFTETVGCTALLLAIPGPGPGTFSAEQAMVDGLIELHDIRSGLRALREIVVAKLRGSAYLRGGHRFAITDAGLRVYPRTEALLASPPEAAAGERAACGFDIPRLDEMLGGGLLSGSTTMLFGSPGSGKTVLGLHFLAAGARQEQPGLYFGFYETPARVAGKADDLGLDFSGLLDRRRLTVLWQPSLENTLDALAERLLRAVREHGIQRLFVDGVNGFRTAADGPARFAPVWTALCHELRAAGVTTLFSAQTGVFFGPEVALPLEGVAELVDSIIFLRYVELRSQLYRLISILKVLESPYDSTIREFHIGPNGIDVAASFESAEAILTGLARPVVPAVPATAESPVNGGDAGGEQ